MSSSWPSREKMLSIKIPHTYTMRHVLHLASNQADRFPQGRHRTDDVVFDISSSAMSVDNDEVMLMHVESACIPVAGYPVNSTNNIIYFASISGDRLVTIPVGVYANGPALVGALNPLLTTALGANAVVLSWDPLTYRISCLRNTTTVYTIDATRTTARSVIGSGYADLSLPISVTVVFPAVIDLAGPKKFLITAPDIELRTRDSLGNGVNVLAAVPVTQTYGGLVVFQNSTGGMLTTNNKTLSELHLTLLDEDQLPVDMNGLEWAVSIVVEIV